MSDADPRFAELGQTAIGLLPHRGPAQLITSALEVSVGFMVCLGRFAKESALVSHGRVDTCLTVECAAQAAAAHLAVLALDRDVEMEELSGFLTSIKSLTIHRPWVPAETDLRIKVKPRGHARGLSKYLFEVFLHEELVCDGELSSFVQNEMSA